MDITIETAVVAIVALVAAVAVLGIATGQVGDFTDFSDDQTSNANCQLTQTQADNCRWTSESDIPETSDSCDISIPDDCS